MKIPCVRCGKTIESPAMYCKECLREMKGRRAGFRLGRWLFVLILVAAAALTAVGIFQPKHIADWRDTFMQQPLVRQVTELAQDALQELSAQTPTPEETPTLSESEANSSGVSEVKTPTPDENTAATDPAALPMPLPVAETALKQNEPSEQLTPPATTPSLEPVPSPAQEPVSETAQETTPEPAQEPVPPTQETNPPSQPAESQATPEAAPESSETAQTPVAEQQQETRPEPVSKPANVWVYYIKSASKGRDLTVADQLRQAGYVNVQAKGNWRSMFRDQNVFYRNRDKAALQELMDALRPGDFLSYHYQGERINHMVKDTFAKNPDLEFLVILQ